MVSRLTLITLATTCSLLIAITAQAGEVVIQHTFQAGTPAKAGEVNTNFADVSTAINDNAADIAALQQLVVSLQASIAALESRLVAVEGNTVLSLDGVVTRDADVYGRDRILISGVNVQITNGVDQETSNGTGNLIIGFDNPRDAGDPVCSAGDFSSQEDCDNSGGVFALSHKTGSHNLVAGDKNSYSRTGGVVFGHLNVINGDFSTVSGGGNNYASGGLASVSGGEGNRASGVAASVSGGISNRAIGNIASISGGENNAASGFASSISGGINNEAIGLYTSITGGNANDAIGDASSISGGSGRTASGELDWVAGGLFQDD